MIPSRAVRLDRYDAVTLDRQAFLNGEIFYDSLNNTLRIYDGKTVGGRSFATQPWVNTNFASLTSVTTNNATINSAIALKAPIASPTFTGTVTGTFSGNVTGNVTGNLTGNVTGNLTGNASTATKLATARNINSVAFDGSASISVSTLVNGSNIAGIDSSGNLIIDTVNNLGVLSADSADSAVYLSDYGYTVAPNANIKIGGSTSIFEILYGPGSIKRWTYDYNGTLTAAGNITTTTGTVTANAVTTTNAVTVGTNVNISTLPTLPQHATNKKYVDARALAMSIAMS